MALPYISRHSCLLQFKTWSAYCRLCWNIQTSHLCYQWNFTPPVEIKPRAKCTSKQLGEADELVLCYNINQTRIDAEVMKCLLKWWCKLITWQWTLMTLCIVDIFFFSKFLPSLHFMTTEQRMISLQETRCYFGLCAHQNVRNPNNLTPACLTNPPRQTEEPTRQFCPNTLRADKRTGWKSRVALRLGTGLV